MTVTTNMLKFHIEYEYLMNEYMVGIVDKLSLLYWTFISNAWISDWMESWMYDSIYSGNWYQV